MFFRNDADSFPSVNRSGKIIHTDTVDPSSYEADYHQTEGVDGKGGGTDKRACHSNGGAYVEFAVFVEDLSQDVQAAGRGIDSEKYGLGSTEDEDEAQQIEPRVLHYGSLSGLNELAVRQDKFPEFNHRSKYQGSINRLYAELLIYEQIGEDQEYSIDYEYYTRKSQMDSGFLEEFREHYGESGDGTYYEFARDEKIIYSRSRNEHSDSHQQEL